MTKVISCDFEKLCNVTIVLFILCPDIGVASLLRQNIFSL